MANEDNHIIRIILEGRDRLSGAFKNSRQSVVSDIDKMRNSVGRLRNDIKQAEIDIERFGRRQSVRGTEGRFVPLEEARRQLHDLQKQINDFKNNNRGSLAGGVFAGLSGASGGGSPLKGLKESVEGLRQGLKEAKETGVNVQAALGTAREEVRIRRAALDEQTRAGQARITQLKFEHQQRLNDQIEQLKADHFRAQENRRQINADRAARRQVFLDEKKAALDLQSELKKVDIKAKAREITSPLSIERRKAVQAGDADAVLAIDRELAKARTVTKKLVAEEEARTRNLKKQLTDRVKASNRADNDILSSRIRVNRQEVQSQIANDRSRLQAASSRLQRIFTARQTTARANLTSPDTLTIRQDLAKVRSEANEASKTLDGAFKRSGRTIGLWTGDLRRGISEGRRGLTDLGDKADKLDTRMARLGRTIGRAVGQFGNLINLRWFILTSAIQLVGTLVVALGANLISVASSAALAAAQIGAVFSAAAAQALPVIGLFAAVTNRVQNIFKAVQLQNQNKISTASESASQLSAVRESAEKLADALYSVKQAYQAVQEAQYQLKQSSFDIQDALQRNKDAVMNLAQTRIDVSRGLVDAIFRERDANLALKEAEFGVIDAKKQLIQIEQQQRQNQQDIQDARGAVREAQQRLAVAKKEGDSAEQANAQAQLAVAQQSLSTIKAQTDVTNTAVKEGKLAVERAKLSRDEAKVEKQRAGEDNKRLQSEGVEGNPQVIAARKEVAASIKAIRDARHQQHLAQLQVADSFHALKIAQRELRDIESDRAKGLDNQISSQRQLKALLDQLSPSERKLYDSLLNIQNVYRKAFRPITDIIVRAITRAVDRSTVILKDPKILAAFTNLANAIGAGIDRISKFTISPEFRKSLEFFINQAAKNMPKVVNIFLKLLDAFIQLAKIGAKPFSHFLDFLDRTTTKLDKFLRNKDKTDKFFSLARQNLDSWIHLAAAIGKILLALGRDSNKSGKSLIDNLAGALDRVADWMNKNPQKVRKFFEDMRKILEGIAHSLVSLAPVLLQAFASPGAAKFAEFIIKVVIPGLVLMIQFLQTISSLLLGITHIPVVGGLVTFFLQFLVAEKALNRIFPVTQKITELAKVFAFGGFKKGLQEAALVFPNLAKGIRLIGAALRFAFVTNPWVAVILGIIAAVYLLDRRFHFIRPTVEALGRAFKAVFNWIKDHWKLVLALLLGPIGLAVDAIVTHWASVKRAFQHGFEFIVGILGRLARFIPKEMEKIGKFILDNFLKPFIGIAKFGAKIETWISDHLFNGLNHAIGTKMKKVANGIYDGFIAAWNRISDFFKKIGSWLQQHVINPILHFFGISSPSKLMFKIGMEIVNGLLNAFKRLPNLILKAIKGIPNLILNMFKDLGKGIVSAIVDKIPGAKTALKIGGKALSAAGKVAEKLDPRKHIPFLHAKGGIIHDKKENIYAAIGFEARGTDTVPAMLTPGEWVLNSIQQGKLARSLGTSKQAIANYLFGPGRAVAPNESNPPRRSAGFDRSMFSKTNKGKGLPGFEGFSGPGFTLVPHTDESGVVVWFAEFADKTFGQINTKDAAKILSSSGQYIPSYLNRSAQIHGGLLPGHRSKINMAKQSLDAIRRQRYATLGAIGHVQAFAQGGPVLNVPSGSNRSGNQVNQHFEVKTQGETDWNYVMKLGAIHAQGSY